MDIARVRDLTDGELGAELITQRRHLYDLRFQLATRQLTDHSQLTQTRRSIARLLTVITERGLDETVVAREAAEPAKPAGRVRGRASTTTKSKESTSKSTSGGKKE